MKKLLSLALVLVLCAALLVPAMAVSYAEENDYSYAQACPAEPDEDSGGFGSIERPGEQPWQVVILFLYDLFNMILGFLGGLFHLIVTFVYSLLAMRFA
ncbi:MAG: hypothetical protein FWE40_09385 [Oscillospiraceae bacterium]|nr:hypothetical protein [Oscillospiraceae bacterium]